MIIEIIALHHPLVFIFVLLYKEPLHNYIYQDPSLLVYKHLRLNIYQCKPKLKLIMHLSKNHEEKDDESMLLLTLWPPGHRNPNFSYTSLCNSSSTSASASAFSSHSEPLDLTIALSIAPPGVGSKGVENQPMVTPGSSSYDRSKYWIPSPAEILVSTAQFSCTVCHRTFKRFNNMQVFNNFIVFFSLKKTIFRCPLI